MILLLMPRLCQTIEADFLSGVYNLNFYYCQIYVRALDVSVAACGRCAVSGGFTVGACVDRRGRQPEIMQHITHSLFCFVL